MISMTDSPILTSILLVSVVAAIYFLYNLYLFCCKPIKRDLLLMRGDFLLRVVLFVVSIPLSVFLLTVVTRYFSSDEEENINTPQVAVVQDSINYTPANSGLVYDGLVKVDGKIEVESKSGTDTSFTKLNFSGELSDNNSHEDIDGSFSKVNIYEDKVDYLNVFWLIYYHFQQIYLLLFQQSHCHILNREYYETYQSQQMITWLMYLYQFREVKKSLALSVYLL